MLCIFMSYPGKWSLRIGTHWKNLYGKTSLNRWPEITIERHIEKTGEFSVTTAFGGMVNLWNYKAGSIEIELDNVVPTLTFTLGQSHDEWEVQRHHPGVWCFLSGKLIMFTVPSYAVRHLRFDEVTKALEFWDGVVELNYDLRGDSPEGKRMQWIQSDKQLRGGYMHAGYPIRNYKNLFTYFIYPVTDLLVCKIVTL